MGTNFYDKSQILVNNGYSRYIDPERQGKTGRCGRCNNLYQVVSFVKDGQYEHIATCSACGAWMSLTDDSQYFYPSIAGHLTEAQRQAKWVNRILHWAWLVDTYNEFEKALDPAHLKIMEAAGIQISEEWWYDLRWPRPELPELVVKQMELF